MSRVTTKDLAAALEQLQAQMAEITKRLATMAHSADSVIEEPEPAPAATPSPEPAGITEEELIAISAAIGAYLGVRAHIRQVRLVSSNAWAQQGRVSIQASHRLQG